MDHLLAILAGIGLSAACGFRVFIPLLVGSIAAKAGAIQLTPDFAWIESDAALVTFGVSTVVEVVAYFVPWLDHLLDTVASPAAVVAGTVVMGTFIADMEPWLKWTLAAIAGGGAAAAVQSITVTARAASTTTTLGLANPLIALVESLCAAVLSILAIVVPVLAGLLVLALLFLAIRKILGFFRRREGRVAK